MTSTWITVGNSAGWKRVRRLVLERDNYRCRIQLPGCLGIADQVHHKLGRAITGDNPETCEAACRKCNQSLGEPNSDAAEIRTMTQW